MTTNSYPAVGNNGDVNDAQQTPVHAIGDGIVEDFGVGATEAFRLTVNDGANTITLTPGKARVGGYIGEGQTETLSVPTVGSTTVYSVAWCYDPAWNVAEGGGGRSALGPVRLQVVAGALDTTGGKRWLVLYTITRAAAQALSLATRGDHRRWVGPVLTMPDWVGTANDTVPRGSLLIQTDYEGTTDAVAISSRAPNTAETSLIWQSLNIPTAASLPLASGLVAVDSPPQYVREGAWINLRGTIRRSNSTGMSGITLATLPAGSRPSDHVRQIVPAISGASQGFAVVYINTAGTVGLYGTEGGFPNPPTYVQLDGIRFRVGG